MRYVKVCNVTRNTVLGQKIRVASSLFDRAIGLLGTSYLSPGEGLWLKPCRSIHTLFMRYPIDALFLDAEDRVVGRQTLSPWRFSKWFRKTRSVVELAAGALDPSGTTTGDRIVFEDLPAGRQASH